MDDLSQQQIAAIRGVMRQQDALETRKAEIKESLASIAKDIGVKPARLTKLIQLVRKEQRTLGTLDSETELLEAAAVVAN